MLVRARTEVKEKLLLSAISGDMPHEPKNRDNLFFLNSGSSALSLFLSLFGKEKRVGVQVFTCSTVVDAICSAGDIPVFLDINPRYFTTTFDVLEKRLSEIDILLLTHLFGIPNPDYILIKNLCAEMGIVMVDDLCQTFHSKIGDSYLEDLSDNYFYSFFYDKPISCLGGGMLKVASKYEEQISKKYSLLPQYDNRMGRRRLKTLYSMHMLLAPELYSQEFRYGLFWKFLLGHWPLNWNYKFLSRIVNGGWMNLMDRFYRRLKINDHQLVRMSEIEMLYVISMMAQYHDNNKIFMDFLIKKDIVIPDYLNDDRITCSCAKRAIIKQQLMSSQAQIALYNWPNLACERKDDMLFPNALKVIESHVNIPCWTNEINSIELKRID